MPTKEGWDHDRDHDKITLGKKQYRNMEEWSRPCGVCGQKFSIFVRANGAAVNSSFGLKTCKDHRGQKITGGAVLNDARLAQMEAELKEVYEGAAEAAAQAGGVRKAIYEELGLSLIGDGITYDTVKTAIRNLKGQYELSSAIALVAENKFPWVEK